MFKNIHFMRALILLASVLLLMATTIFAAGDLLVELGEPQIQPRDGYSEDVFVPFFVKNIGDEPIVSRFPVRIINPASRSGIGYPLYAYSDVKKEVPIIKSDGEATTRLPTTIRIKIGDGEAEVPAIQLFPGEKISFHEDIMKPLLTFSYSDSGTYTVGYEVDPVNEVVEADDTNNIATAELALEVKPYVKGPNLNLAENQYWFYYPNKEGCHTLDVPEPLEICLVSYGPLTAKLTIGGEEVTLWHFFEIWGWTKKFNNLELVSADGFLLTYQ
ncbi:hypothetical protein J4210_02530 [Candidatus Woesearchaeota archaeon]|nr:hypothetical protein [Candidatus Woesearchaeota archaeon]